MLGAPSISPDKVAVYIRWSTDDQGEGTTLETQRERCRHYLGSQGWTFREDLVYVDDGCSGGSLDRPALTRLRADVAAGRVECVVVYKIDRLSRSVVDIVDLVLREWEGRCYVKSTTEDVNTLTPAGKVFFYILISFAEYERNVIRERTMGGKVKRAEQGLNPGFRPPYGYVKGRDAGTVAVVDHEASVVRRIFDHYLKGNGIAQIAHILNTEGSRRRGGLWSQLAVRRILANPAYCGVLEYGRTMRTSKEQRERHGLGTVMQFEQPRFARVEGAFPAIVERRVWEEANLLLRSRSRKAPGRPTYSTYLLSGLATCRCGAPVGGKGAGGRQYYYCTARKRHGPSVCAAAHVPVGIIDREIEQRVRALLAREIEPALIGALEEGLAERVREVEAGIARQKAGLVAAGERRRRLETDYRAGDLPAKLYASEAEAVRCEADEALALARTLEEQLHALREVRVETTLSQIDLWGDMNVPERRQLLRKLTAGIRLYRQEGCTTLEIDWICLNRGVPPQ
ncbi:MAG TPA: recombinase family protein [Symbiobacteriaceae bacterium]|nr:recombinase family protein [Symbiobacteriaceae bacterium]